MENINNNMSELLPPKMIYKIIPIICVVISILVRLFTPGWLWFVVGTLGQVHVVLFIMSNENVSKYVNKSLLPNLLFWLSCITFTMIYVLLPDFDDTSAYAICGLIQDEKTLDILNIIVKYSLYINILLIILGFFIRKVDSEKLIERNYSFIKKISIVILIFCILSLILTIFYGTIKGILFYSILSLLMILTVIFFSKKKIYGTISGGASAILLFFSPSILYKIGAIILIIVCIRIFMDENIYEENFETNIDGEDEIK